MTTQKYDFGTVAGAWINKTAIRFSEKQICEFYNQALALEPKLLINYLVKQVTLYDDKIEIQFNAPIKVSPDDESRRGFLFYSKTVKLSSKCRSEQTL